MDIKKVSPYATQAAQMPREVSNRTSGEERSVSGKEAGATPDRVQLSKGYQEVAQAKKVTMAREDIRTEQVDHYRKLIESNNYTVEPEKVAGKMLENLF